MAVNLKDVGLHAVRALVQQLSSAEEKYSDNRPVLRRMRPLEEPQIDGSIPTAHDGHLVVPRNIHVHLVLPRS
jgi:hypothetical protein